MLYAAPTSRLRAGNFRAVAKFFYGGHAPAEICTLSLHDALPIYLNARGRTGKTAAADHVLVVATDNREGATAAHSGHGLAVEFLVERQILDHQGGRNSTRLNSSHTVSPYVVCCSNITVTRRQLPCSCQIFLWWARSS